MLKRGLDQILKSPFTILRNINTFIRFLWKKSLHIIARVLWSRFPKELNKPNKSWPQQWRFIVQMSIPFWIYFYGQSKTPCRQNWSISDLSVPFISSLLTRFIFWETAALIMPLSNIKICWEGWKHVLHVRAFIQMCSKVAPIIERPFLTHCVTKLIEGARLYYDISVVGYGCITQCCQNKQTAPVS